MKSLHQEPAEKGGRSTVDTLEDPIYKAPQYDKGRIGSSRQ
jgi:hypothetical protein